MRLGENGIDRVLWEQSGERLDKWYRGEAEIDPSFFLNDASASFDIEVDENDPRFDVLSSGESRASSQGFTDSGDPDYDDEGSEEDYESYSEEGSFGRRRRRRQADENSGYMYTGNDMESGATGILLTQEDIDAMKALYETEQQLANQQMLHDVPRIKPKAGKGIFVTIEGERGHGYRGDIALDDIRVTDTRCSIWMEWSSWNVCSHTCGGGVQIRERECTLKNIEKCKGDFKEHRDCNMHTCGGWSCNFDNG